MAMIRCPMCGKPASNELEVCPVCQARLKPLIISSADNDPSINSKEEPVGKETPEFQAESPSESGLAGEGSIQPGQVPDKKKTSEQDFELPAWLRKLRGLSGQKQPSAQTGSEELNESAEQLEHPGQENAPDETMESPEKSEVLSSADALNEGSPINPAEDEVPDWLSGLAQTSQEENENPAWLSNIKDMPQKERAPSGPVDENTPKEDENWLTALRGDASAHDPQMDQDQDETTHAEPPFDEDLPDWMKKLKAEVDAQTPGSQMDEEIPAEAGEDTSPVWLNRLQAEARSNSASNESAPSDQVDEGPDWLEKMSDETPSTSEVTAPIGSEIPEWLQNLQAETQAFAQDPQPEELEHQASFEESQPSSTDFPEWLQELQTDTGISEEENKDQPDRQADDTVASPLLAETNLQPSSETPAASSQEISQLDPEATDWLHAMESELQDPTLAANPPDGTEELTSPDARSSQTLTGSDEEDELMRSGMEAASLTEPVMENELDQHPAGELSDLVSDEQQQVSELIPDWLKNVEKNDIDTSGIPHLSLDDRSIEIGSETGISAEVPEWLRTLETDSPAPLPEEKQPETGLEGDVIKPAELPSWVQALRPVESIVADLGTSGKQLEQITETMGPLAGLQGVLPNSPGLGKLRKPLNFSTKLRVTEDQSSQADQLEHMLAVESQPRSETKNVKLLPQRIIRWVVSVIVLLVLALPIASGQQNISAPTIYPPELVAFREILFGLPPASPVLLVFDYEPAYAGELEVTASSVVDNLLVSGARLTVLSTSPYGPILAENFLKNIYLLHNYQSGMQYTNLGYLAGGASGVLSFALDPSQTIPLAIDGSQPWQSPVLQDVRSLADFKAVVILTDNSDTARIWVEQTTVLLGETPLLMAISAQAEPMIRPYYDSKQIRGLVTGLAGGKAYEQALQRTGLGQLYWDSFSYGLFIAELIIIFGALWSIISIWRNRKSVHEEEA